MGRYAAAGFDAFDMADHYGSAELIAGRFLKAAPRSARVFTKWCPKPEAMTRAVVQAGIEERLKHCTIPQGGLRAELRFLDHRSLLNP